MGVGLLIECWLARYLFYPILLHHNDYDYYLPDLSPTVPEVTYFITVRHFTVDLTSCLNAAVLCFSLQ